MKKKDKYKRMKQDTRTDKDSLTSRMKKGKISPYPGKIRQERIYNPGRTTISSIATIKKIAGSVLTPISRVRGISSAKKGGSFVAHFNPYTLHPGSSIFFIVALAKLVVLPGL